MPELRPHELAANGPALGRRHFVIGVVVIGAGLGIGVQLARRNDRLYAAARAREPFAPHAFVRIDPDDAITVIIGKSEMGQGVHTSLPTILAEELDVDPTRLRVEFAPVDPAFNHPAMPMQFTGGSSSASTTFESLRKAGALARTMLIAAAARTWQVDASSLRTEDGVVTDGTRRARYGELVAVARELEPPTDVPLKDPKDFRFIGKPVRRLDSLAKVTGRAQFGLDVQRPGMLVAMVARSPTFGGAVIGFRDAATRAIPGVVAVRQIPSGVAVLATNTWAARRGRDALEIDWDAGAGAHLSTRAIREQYRRLAVTPGAVAKQTGDVDRALASARRVLDAEYELPFLAHACMEPLNCVAEVRGGECEIWTGTQFQTVDAASAGKAAGIGPENVRIHTTFLGGGFGRRANPQSDFVVEAVHLAKASGRPVKVVWTREDDTRGGWYRPFWLHRLRGGIDRAGMPLAWRHTVVGQSILNGTWFAALVGPDGIDPTSAEGASDMPYAIPNLRVELHSPVLPVTVQWWRSVGHSHTGFVVNSFLDELADAARRDPLELRRALLAEKPRHLAVLDLAAEKAGWHSLAPSGRSRGVALQESFGSIVAQIAEVSVSGDSVRVHRVVCAIDCGRVVNPAQVEAQMESGIVFGLSAALRGAITLRDGLVEQSNFNDYPVLRMNEMPRVETHIVASDGPMGGVGEPGVPCIAPAVCNAMFAATGKRTRRLPIAASLGGA
ncbi:MAG: molybdopterin cofactor-binding domain-containing protein [Steroidobacteraceae bacterium]